MIIPRCRGLRLAFTLVTSLYVCMNNNDYPSMQRIATLTCFFCLCLECSIITMIIPRCRGLRLDLSPYINYELVMNITMIIPRCRGLRPPFFLHLQVRIQFLFYNNDYPSMQRIATTWNSVVIQNIFPYNNDYPSMQRIATMC